MKIVLISGNEFWTENFSKIEVSHKINNEVKRDVYPTTDDSLVASLVTHQIIYGTGVTIRLHDEDSDIEGILIPYISILFTETESI